MTTDYIDLKEAKYEVLYWLRNEDIFTITQRGVTTDTDTGTFSNDSTYLIAVSNIKNVRSIVVAGTTLKYGTEYKVDIDFNDSGTIKTKITFVSAQTGAYTITYDYGSTDKIFPDFPLPNSSISSFPRIGFDFLDVTTNYGGLGNVMLSNATIQLIAYSKKTEELDELITTVRQKVIEKLEEAINNTGNPFYYFPKYIRPDLIGPTILSPRELGKNKIVQKNFDIRGDWKYEIN